MTEIKYGREVIGDYGESAGVSCPYCGQRNYPRAENISKCDLCGNDYRVPMGCKIFKLEVVK